MRCQFFLIRSRFHRFRWIQHSWKYHNFLQSVAGLSFLSKSLRYSCRILMRGLFSTSVLPGLLICFLPRSSCLVATGQVYWDDRKIPLRASATTTIWVVCLFVTDSQPEVTAISCTSVLASMLSRSMTPPDRKVFLQTGKEGMVRLLLWGLSDYKRFWMKVKRFSSQREKFY